MYWLTKEKRYIKKKTWSLIDGSFHFSGKNVYVFVEINKSSRSKNLPYLYGIFKKHFFRGNLEKHNFLNQKYMTKL